MELTWKIGNKVDLTGLYIGAGIEEDEFTTDRFIEVVVKGYQDSFKIYLDASVENLRDEDMSSIIHIEGYLVPEKETNKFKVYADKIEVLW
jgi:hypothetical protein